MFKPLYHTLLAAAVSASALLAACSPGTQLQPLRPTSVQGQSVLGGQSAVRGDWYAALAPQLQQYYAPARGKTGRDLLLALHQIVSQGQQVKDYQTAKSFLYATADHISLSPTQSGVYDAYSGAFILGNGGDGNTYREAGDTNQDGQPGDFINLEHTWPQSFFNKVEPMVSDMHHMFATLSKPNAMRSNFPIGMAEGTVVYTTNGGAKLSAFDKTGKHSPAETIKIFNLAWEQQPHDVVNNDYKVTFEPPNPQKGNSARALMYFYLRYFDGNIRNGGYDEVNFWDSKVATYSQWAQQDPPDAQEVKRHEAVAQNQRNRNPFIDIPNLAELIGVDVMIKDADSRMPAVNARSIAAPSLTRPD